MQYCEGKDFTAGGLRNAAHLVRAAAAPPVPVPVARVVRIATASAMERPRREPGQVARGVEAALVLEIGETRLSVGPGFDNATLTALLDVLSARRGAL